jgi:hypothetical protein
LDARRALLSSDDLLDFLRRFELLLFVWRIRGIGLGYDQRVGRGHWFCCIGHGLGLL